MGTWGISTMRMTNRKKQRDREDCPFEKFDTNRHERRIILFANMREGLPPFWWASISHDHYGDAVLKPELSTL